MFESLDEQMKRDDNLVSSTNARMIRYALIRVGRRFGMRRADCSFSSDELAAGSGQHLRLGALCRPRDRLGRVERKIFWMTFIVLGLIADVVLPLWWGLAATIPIFFVSWWVAYRSHWF